MFDFKNFVRGKTSATDLRTAIDEIATTLSAAQAALDEHRDARGRVLLDGDAAAIEALETKLRDGKREVERLGLARDELHKRLVDAKGAERAAILDAQYNEALAAQKHGLVLVGKYENHAKAIAAILSELHAVDEVIVAANAALSAEASDTRRVKRAGAVADGEGGVRTVDLIRVVQLHDVSGAPGKIWPPATLPTAQEVVVMHRDRNVRRA